MQFTQLYAQSKIAKELFTTPPNNKIPYIYNVTNSIQNIELYKSLFRGRTDIYAVRWEKNDRNGYMPAYKVDWADYNKHKAQSGSFKDYKNKKYLPLNNFCNRIAYFRKGHYWNLPIT